MNNPIAMKNPEKKIVRELLIRLLSSLVKFSDNSSCLYSSNNLGISILRSVKCQTNPPSINPKLDPAMMRPRLKKCSNNVMFLISSFLFHYI